MRIIRLACPKEAASVAIGQEVFLNPDQARHGALVLRLVPGDMVEMVGAAGLALAKVTVADKNIPRLGVIIAGPWIKQEHQGPRLALALIQSQRFDWAVEKAVELGAATLIPLITERVKSGGEQPGQAKQKRWSHLAEEARKQCGRSLAMDIFPPLTMAELIEQPGPGLFLSPGGPMKISPGVQSPLLVIGPEGGLSLQEEERLLSCGFKPWSLGSTILRAETAALAALAIVMADTNRAI